MRKILLVLCGLLCIGIMQAQTIADDPEFKVGQLSSGLTYYLCHNENPAGCAEFYIVHHVGALQEEDNQNGLAHFLEHMAFNGTRHYPDKGLLEFLAKEGVRFGYNVNAYTAKTETVYNLSNVPLVRDSFVDSVLMVLHDWSCDISCEQKALDEERGVISEEWRLSDDSRSRMANKQTALIYKGAKQAERNVIGSYEVINGFKREEILDFYHKWYRPDLQALVVVGDFDVDDMDARIRRLFSDIPAPVNPEPKGVYVPVPLTETLFEDMTDPEIKYQAVKLFFKQHFQVTDRKDEAFYKDFLCRMVVNSVLADRLKEFGRDKGCAVQNATVVTSPYNPQMYVTMITAVPKKKEKLLDALVFCEREVRRLVQCGISQDELDVAKLNVSTRLHLDVERSRDEVKNRDIVGMAVNNFLLGSPLVMPGTFNEIRQSCMAGISLDDVTPYLKVMFEDSERIVSNCYNDVEEKGLAPSREQMQAAIASVAGETVTPRFLDYPKLDLTVDAVPGSVKSVSKVKGADMELWTLSNGVKVYYKEAAPVKTGNHLSMTLLFDTGYKCFEQDKINASRFALSYCKRNAGFRDCAKPELRNYPEMAGVGVMLSGGNNSARIEVTAEKGKAETAFKAAYLQLTEPGFGGDRLISLHKASALKSLGKVKTPKNLYEERVRDFTYGGHPWMREMDSLSVEMTDKDLIEDVFRRYYGDIAGMKVVLCSDLPREEIRGYVERYIASLSADYPYTKGKYLPAVPAIKGAQNYSETNPPVSAPLSDISCNYYFKGGRTVKERARIDILDYILSARYLALIREERGGAYSVFFTTAVSDDAAVPSRSYVEFQTRPEMRDLLIQDVADELARMCKDGPTDEEMDFAVKYLVKHFREDQVRISRSLSLQEEQMLKFVRWGTPYGYDYAKVVSSVKASEVRAMARRIAGGDSLVKVYNEE